MTRKKRKMTGRMRRMTKASKIVALGRSQIGVKESPPGSNRTKYGKDFGWNGVAWCAIYSWWKGWRASKKKESQNPIYKSASAANIQDLTVKCKKGTYIMKMKDGDVNLTHKETIINEIME